MGSTHELYIIIIECHMNTIYMIIIVSTNMKGSILRS